MYFKRQELKYKHYLFEDKVLIGLSEEISKEEASVFLNHPMLMYEYDIYGKLFKLEPRERQVIINALDGWEKEKKKEKREKKIEKKSEENRIVGRYWDIVLDYILYLYEVTTGDLAKEMLKMSYFKNYDEKTIFDNIEKMRTNKNSVREQGRELVRQICYCYKITEDVVRTGKGIMYFVKNDKDFTAENVDAYCNSHDRVVLKKMVADITGVKQNEVLEIPIQIAVKVEKMEKRISDFLGIILDEMIKNKA